jgi:integrase
VARGIERLSALTISRKLSRGYYADGGGLYLQVSPSGSKSWVFRYRDRGGGRLREMGLGSFLAVFLAQARQEARRHRSALQEGLDPIEQRNTSKAVSGTLAAKSFEECANAYISSHKSEWRNEKHAKQWSATIKAYAAPMFGTRRVAEINIELVLRVLEPIWATKPETASRLRGRIEAVLDWAKVRGYRVGDNPARWKGNLDKLLPKQKKAGKVKHHAALPFADLPNFIGALRQQKGIGAAALEFVILTASRTSEVIGATWSEINFETRVWSIGQERMKAGRAHRVPLTANAINILRRMEKIKDGEAVFPGQKPNSHLSNMTLLSILRKMGRPDLTTHGFRSTFRDWVSESTDFSREVAEMALAHTIDSKVEAAYRRGDLFEKRRILMQHWANYCSDASSEVAATAFKNAV